MKMDLQKFNDENNGDDNQTDPNQGQPNQGGDDKQPSEPSQSNDKGDSGQGKSDNEKYFMNVAKKMNNFLEKNQAQGKEPSQGKPKGNDSASHSSQPKEPDDNAKKLQDLQDKYNKLISQQNSNDLSKYTSKQLSNQGIKVDDDTFDWLQGNSKEAIDSNIKHYQDLQKKFTSNVNNAPKSFNKNGHGSKNTTAHGPKPKDKSNGIEQFYK